MAIRLFDAMVAAVLYAVAMLVTAVASLRRRPVTRRVGFYGRLGEPQYYRVRRLFGRGSRLWAVDHADVLRLVIAGKLSLTGPRPDCLGRPRPFYGRFVARPGLVSPHLVRARANIAFDSAEKADERFLRAASLKTRAALLARFALTFALAPRRREVPSRIELLGVSISNVSMATAVGRVCAAARGASASQFAFVNADCLNIAARNAGYRATLRRIAHVFADGIGIHYALRLFTPWRLRENVNGTDLFPRLCAEAQAQGLALYLLGARPGVAEAVAREALARFPRLRIAGTRDGYFPSSGSAQVIESINASGADILLVALGAPRQDVWIAENLSRLRVGAAMGVGGLFDFYSGRIPRAPEWLRELGLEWAYRLRQEPRRMWRRYVIGNPAFLWRVWRSSHARRAEASDAGQSALETRSTNS